MGATRPTLFKLKCPGHIIMTRKILAIHSTCGLIGSLFSKTQTGIYILVGIYAKHSDEPNAGVKSTTWDTIMLAFTNEEMSLFMSEVKQKKDPTKDDRMFGFGFDSSKAIYQTRGFREIRDMSQYLIENRLDEIRNSFT